MGSGGPDRPPLMALPPRRFFSVVEGTWLDRCAPEKRVEVRRLLRRGQNATIDEVPGVPIPTWFPDDALPPPKSP